MMIYYELSICHIFCYFSTTIYLIKNTLKEADIPSCQSVYKSVYQRSVRKIKFKLAFDLSGLN